MHTPATLSEYSMQGMTRDRSVRPVTEPSGYGIAG